MIIADGGNLIIKGEREVVLAELTTIIHEVYDKEKELTSEKEANEMLAEVGRLAVMTPEQVREELMKELKDMFGMEG